MVSVPNGNFGNLVAGLVAKRMGLHVRKFIAGVNSNNVFPAHPGKFVDVVEPLVGRNIMIPEKISESRE